MRLLLSLLFVAVTLTFTSGCGGAGSGATTQAGPPFKAVANVEQLMLGTVQHAAATYWNSVSTVVDKDGIHEYFPKNDMEWTTTWAAAITIAESGNLLMMSERARADADWNKFALELVEAGNRAAQAAEARNADLVLEQGEKVYDVCTACHMKFIVDAEQP
jgi:hypothetical protein